MQTSSLAEMNLLPLGCVGLEPFCNHGVYLAHHRRGLFDILGLLSS